MSVDMTTPLFENYAYGKAALKKLGDVPENFRFFMAELSGKYPNYHGMQLQGCEFRIAKRGPNVGKLSIMVPDTTRTVYVSNKEIKAEEGGAQ